MKEYVIQEDRGRLALYTGLFLILMILLMIASIAFFTVGWYLFSFLGITGLWFDVKAMFRYGNKLVRKKTGLRVRKRWSDHLLSAGKTQGDEVQTDQRGQKNPHPFYPEAFFPG